MIEVVLLLFCTGLAIGSFLNVVIYRMVHKDSPLQGRSYCDHCKKQIAWYDNIPIVSFLLLRSRCRYCKKSIPWQYPTVEFLTGALFVWWYIVGFTFFRLSSGSSAVIQPLFWLAVGVLFLVIVFADISYMIIPDSATLLLTIASIGYRSYLVLHGIMRSQDLWYALLAAFGGFLFLFGLFLITKGRGMGFGDVKLMFPLGVLLGFPNVIAAFFLACLTGATIGIALRLIQRQKISGVIPFGPFLILGTVLALVWGSDLMQWYRGFL